MKSKLEEIRKLCTEAEKAFISPISPDQLLRELKGLILKIKEEASEYDNSARLQQNPSS